MVGDVVVWDGWTVEKEDEKAERDYLVENLAATLCVHYEAGVVTDVTLLCQG